MAIVRFGPDRFAEYRELRLLALKSDPTAFGSSYEREIEFDEATWRQRLSDFDGRPGAVFVELQENKTVGTVTVGISERPSVVLLVAMWVMPEFRRRGIAHALLESALQWTRTQAGVAEVQLQVTYENDAAAGLYASAGFVNQKGVFEVDSDAERLMVYTLTPDAQRKEE